MKIIKYLSILIFIPILIIIYILRPLIFIRWFPYDIGSRIGSLIPSIESFHLKKQKNKLTFSLFLVKIFVMTFLKVKYEKKIILLFL